MFSLLVILLSAFLWTGAARVEPAAPAPVIATAEQLMDATKAATDELDRLAFNVRYTKLFFIADDLQQRSGRAIVVTDARTEAERALEPDAPPRRAFGLRFETLMTDRRVEPELRELAFDGEWFAERIPAEKLVIRRQLAPPGEPIDAFKLGEGPFVVLIGQDKSDVLQRYTAAMPDDPTQGLTDHDHPAIRGRASTVAGTHQLHLTIRPELADDSTLQDVRIWYDRATLLPTLALQTKASEDVEVVQLQGPRLDSAVTPTDVALIDTGVPAEPGWDVQIHEYRAPARAEALP